MDGRATLPEDGLKSDCRPTRPSHVYIDDRPRVRACASVCARQRYDDGTTCVERFADVHTTDDTVYLKRCYRACVYCTGGII